MLIGVWIAYKTWEYFHPFTAMPLVRSWYYVRPESQSFKRDVQKCKRVQSILSDIWKNIMGGSWSPSAHREGIASQEISNLLQHKYRLDPRRGGNISDCEGCEMQRMSSKQDMNSLSLQIFKNRRNSFQSMLESWELRNIYNQLWFSSWGGGGGGMWQQYPWGLPWTFAFYSSPLP